MMTLRQLHDAVAARVGDSFSLDVEVWHHRYAGLPDDITVEYRIYITVPGERGRQYASPTTEGVLALLVAATTEPHAPLEAADAALSELPGA